MGNVDASKETEKANALKTLGNEYFAKGQFPQAIRHYTDAIACDNSVAAFFLNRALVYIRTECPGAALSDCESALLLDPRAAKGYYRRAFAHEMLGHHSDAIQALRQCLQICPNDKDAQTMLAACEKEVQRQKFLKAIATPDEKRPFETMRYQDMHIEASYSGPTWDDDQPLTISFIESMMREFCAGRLIHRRHACRLMLEAREIFAKCSNVVLIELMGEEEITVCGDIHGQYFDLENLFKINGTPSLTNRYLFNGDVVDRGSYSVECLLTFLAYKILYPNHFFLARGNHEGLNLNKVYGFEGEMRAKYNTELYDLTHDVFRSLPLAHVIGGKVFVVHGGLFSQNGVTVEQLNSAAVNRFRDIPEDGFMGELLWSDPQPQNGRAPNKRGVGIAFGPDVTEDFLRANGFTLLVRSHEVKEEGYLVEHGGRCITVFSAPNYCDQVGNKAAFLRFSNKILQEDPPKPHVTQFNHVQHIGRKPMQYSPFMI